MCFVSFTVLRWRAVLRFGSTLEKQSSRQVWTCACYVKPMWRHTELHCPGVTLTLINLQPPPRVCADGEERVFSYIPTTVWSQCLYKDPKMRSSNVSLNCILDSKVKYVCRTDAGSNSQQSAGQFTETQWTSVTCLSSLLRQVKRRHAYAAQLLSDFNKTTRADLKPWLQTKTFQHIVRTRGPENEPEPEPELNQNSSVLPLSQKLHKFIYLVPNQQLLHLHSLFTV